MTTNGKLHPGISIHNIPVAGGAAGLLFAVCGMLVFLLGIPMLPWFLGGAVAIGLAVAFGLRFVHKRSSSPLTSLNSRSGSFRGDR